MKPKRPANGVYGCNSFIYGRLLRKDFLVYVRITLNDETEEGTGPIPPILIDAASELNAEPHVIRVHMENKSYGTHFSYFGFAEFVAAVRSNVDEWNERILKPRTFEHYVKMVKGRISKLNIKLNVNPVKRKNRPEEIFIDLILKIDGKRPYYGTIDPIDLMRSTVEGGEFFIFTCGCGVPQCSGIWHGVVVAYKGNMVLWKAHYAKGQTIFIFDKEQYRCEILGKCAEAIRLAREGKERHLAPYGYPISDTEEAYYKATENL